MSDQSDKDFDLVFEGPKDNSAETLRKIKGVFIADLELSVDEVQRILQEAPLIIKSSDNENDLKVVCKSLQAAGGKVLILKRGKAAEEDSHDELSFELDLSEQYLELGDEEPTPKVFSLDYNPDSDAPAEDEKSMLETDASAEPAAPAPEPNAALKHEELDLTLAPEEKLLDLREPHSAAQPVAATLKSISDEDISSLSLDPEAAPEIDAPTPVPSEPLSFELTSTGDASLAQNKKKILGSAPYIEAPKEEAPLDLGFEESAPPKKPNQSPIKSEPPIEIKAETPPAPAPQKEEPPKLEPMSKEIDLTVAPEPESAPPPAAHHPSAAPKLSDFQATNKPSALKAKIETEVDPLEQSQDSDQEALHAKPLRSQRSESRTKVFGKDVMLAILLGLAGLSAFNYYLYTQNKALAASNVAAAKATAIKAAALKKAAQVPTQAPPKNTLIVGDFEELNISTNWQFDVEDGIVTRATITLSTSRPPEPSAEEVGQGVVRAAWLRKLQIDLVKIDLTPEGTFSHQTNAKVYVDDHGQTIRSIGLATVKGSYDKKNGMVSGEISIISGDDALNPDKPYYVELVSPGKYKYSLSTHFHSKG